jgi:NAD(P)-dependent dehydrogenase (short-subunit alcohol dehydrogenase family)
MSPNSPDPSSLPIAVLTGGTRGIGRATALGLAGAGYHVVLVTRSASAGDAVTRALSEVVPGRFSWVEADLKDPGQVLETAISLASRHPRISLLVNNAAVALRRYQATPGGIEETLAVNHLAHVVLTHGLLPALLRQGTSGGARILNVSSEAHAKRLDLTAFEGPKGYSGLHAYAQSKLLNLIHTFDLARSLEGTGVQVHGLHPGLVATELLSGFVPAGLLRRVATPLIDLLAMSPEAGAKNTIFTATTPETLTRSGLYWVKQAVAQPAPVSRDVETHDGIHQWTEALIGIPWRAIPGPG